MLFKMFSMKLSYYPENSAFFPLAFHNIQHYQEADATLLELADKDDFQLQKFNGTDLIAKQDQNNHWRIVIPEALIQPTIEWYHGVMGHAGTDRLATSISNHLWFPSLHRRIEEFVSTCAVCQHNKNPGVPYGHPLPREDTSQPFEEISVDLIGPWRLRIPNMGELSLLAVTITDTCTTLTEIQQVASKHAEHVAQQVENTWIARYPLPQPCIHDNGTEFLGMSFQAMLQHN